MGVAEIPLHGRYGQSKVARVDERFADAVRAHKWYLSNGHVYAKISGVTVYLQRYILTLAEIPIPNRIDHVNCSMLDCCLDNLRPARSIMNPQPVEDDSRAHYLSVAELDASERRLRAYLTERGTELQLRTDETLWLATGRIRELTIEGLTKTRAARWSSLGQWTVHTSDHTPLSPHVGRKPPRSPAPGDLWHDTSCLPHVVREYSPGCTWRIVLDNISSGMSQLAVRSLLASLLSDVEVTVRWPRLSAVNEDIQIMLANRMGQAGCDGRPAYLACATLAALLEVETQHVINLLANHRRTPRPASRAGNIPPKTPRPSRSQQSDTSVFPASACPTASRFSDAPVGRVRRLLRVRATMNASRQRAEEIPLSNSENPSER